MLSSIIKKEWIKLRFYVVALLALCLGVVAYFAYNLDFSFSTVEPESMMWYRFVNLEQKPYYMFTYLFIIIATLISFAQFLPEKIKNRIKIMTHLPISLQRSLYMHLLIGLLFISILSIFLIVSVGYVIFHYYTYEILLVMLKDFCFYVLGSFIFYVALSAAIIENNKIMSFIKISIGVMVLFVFIENRYYTQDILYIFVFLIFVITALDSFCSIKKQRVKNIFYFLFVALGICFISYKAYALYQDKYQKVFNRYYLFYSAPLKEFVYQKNFGDHRFEYGIQDQKVFGREEYESYLPFVYWRNLDIQKKLPISIDGKNYDKKTIKETRLSLSYSPSLLKEKEVRIYPLLNPDSSLGMIKFPEHMIQFNALHVKAYNFDDGENNALSKEINGAFAKNNVQMPIQDIWGKATNMKPYDLGYLLLDSKDKLFNINRLDNVVHLKEINYPKGIKIRYIKLSENKQRKVAGYAIDMNSNFYLLDWNFNFKKVELEGFDYKNMKLQFISNALYYLIRYDDGNAYNAVVFTKEFKKIKKIKMLK